MIRNNESYARNGPHGHFEFGSEILGMPKSWDYNFLHMCKDCCDGGCNEN